MKQSLLAPLFLCLSFTIGLANADVALKAKEEVTGTWMLRTSKNSVNDRRPATREDIWVFKDDSTVTITHIPREGTYYDQPPVPYEIVDGKLKVSVLGGSRFEMYTVIELDDKKMTLKGKFGDYYFFEKKS
jgi:Lipocalin-like domain